MSSHINLLPWEFRRRNIARRLLKRWAVVAGLLLVASGMIIGDRQQRLNHSRAELQQLISQTTPARQIAAESQRLTELLERSDERRSLLDSLNATGQPLQLIGIVSSSAAATPGRILVQRFEVTETEPAIATRETQATVQSTGPVVNEAATRQLTLSGMATDDLALSHFIAQLRDVGVFQTVELRTSNDVALAAGSARRYAVECSF